ncbi:RrF2 family transcriptional regulator [Victivallis vadensis]|uniref:RrF2 family transcriptional regulator n=1 Tax=Victivallis vadensis TaxID=172901 RepID=UPI003CFDDE5A
MLNLSTKSRYGLRILLQLAQCRGSGRSCKVRELAEQQSISDAYVEQIMIALKGSGLVLSARGRNGGYLLGRVPADITVLDVIELFEGRIDLVGCTGQEQRCARIAGCLSRTVWQRLSEAFRREAAAITLADILNSPPACVSEYSI